MGGDGGSKRHGLLRDNPLAPGIASGTGTVVISSVGQAYLRTI